MITHKELDNGYKYIEIENDHAEAKIALQGAHLFHYQAKGKEPLLWLSELAHFEEGKAIRGGVPICFPWFGPNQYNANLPQHGFARNQLWKLMSAQELADGSTHLQLILTPNKETRAVWDSSFVLMFDVTIGSELSMELTTINTDNAPFEITQALHSYFNIANIEKVSIQGLDKVIYYSNLNRQLSKQHGDVVINEEVDRVYFDMESQIKLIDKERTIELNQEGSNSLVVWNPWIEKAKSMADMPDDGYQSFVCLETANAFKDFKLLWPSEMHSLKVVISEP